MAEVDYTIIGGILTVYTVVWGIVFKMFWSAFSKHKDSVQYKDNCQVQVKSFEAKLDSAKELVEQKFDWLGNEIEEIKELVKNKSK